MYFAYASEAQAVALSFLERLNSAILYPAILLFSAVALLIFLWGAFEYVKNAGSEAGREQGRQHLLWGTVGLLVMLSAYAILSVAAATVGLDVDEIQSSGGGSWLPISDDTSGTGGGAVVPGVAGPVQLSNTAAAGLQADLQSVTDTTLRGQLEAAALSGTAVSTSEADLQAALEAAFPGSANAVHIQNLRSTLTNTVLSDDARRKVTIRTLQNMDVLEIDSYNAAAEELGLPIRTDT